MNIDITRSVGEIAVELPQMIPSFRESGIDYCCGGKISLGEACAAAGVPVGEMVRKIDSFRNESGAEKGKGAADSQWPTLGGLIHHLLKKHHAYTRQQLALLGELSARVLKVHGSHHSELAEVDSSFREMAEELDHHMAKEEQIAFPYLVRLEEASENGQPLDFPFPYEVFRSQPQHCLTRDHEKTGEQLRHLRQLTDNFTPPKGACVTYRAFYQALMDLEADIHQHVHLENNVLFPMAERVALGAKVKV